MALINCPECGTEVSELAVKCPKCACPVARVRADAKLVERMKKSKPSTLVFNIVATTIIAIIGVGLSIFAWQSMQRTWLIFDVMFFVVGIAGFVFGTAGLITNIYALSVKQKWQKGNDKT